MVVDQSGPKPNLIILKKAFAAYQKERPPCMRHFMEVSAMIANVHSQCSDLMNSTIQIWRDLKSSAANLPSDSRLIREKYQGGSQNVLREYGELCFKK